MVFVVERTPRTAQYLLLVPFFTPERVNRDRRNGVPICANGGYDLLRGLPLARGHGFLSLHGSRFLYGLALTLVLVASAFPQNGREDEITVDGLSHASNRFR